MKLRNTTLGSRDDGPADRFDVWVAGMTEASLAYLKGIDEIESPTGVG